MDEWRRAKVSDVCRKIVDCVNRTAPIVDHPTEFRMIRTTNIRHGRIDLSSCKFVDEPTFLRWTRRAPVEEGDVLLTREAPIGEVGYVKDLGSVFLGQRIMQFKPDPQIIDPRFMFFAFRSPELQHQFGVHEGSGSVVSHIRVADCFDFHVPLPPLTEQQAIAQLLGALDDKIELNRRMNETLEAMARAIFKDWFVDFGPTRAKVEGRDPYLAPEIWNLFPDAFDDEERPVGWEVRPLKDFFQIVGGGTPKTSVDEYWGGDIPWFSVVDTPSRGSVFVLDTEKRITERGLAESSARLIPAGATIISARGTVGNLAMAATEMTFNQSCYALRHTEETGNCFVYLAAQHMVARLQAMAHGSVFSTITRQTFEAVSLAMPSLITLAAFEQQAAPLFQRIRANVIETHTLAQTRDLLLPKLMSGEIRLTAAEKMVEAVA